MSQIEYRFTADELVELVTAYSDKPDFPEVYTMDKKHYDCLLNFAQGIDEYPSGWNYATDSATYTKGFWYDPENVEFEGEYSNNDWFIINELITNFECYKFFFENILDNNFND